jgi:hypothetical protein
MLINRLTAGRVTIRIIPSMGIIMMVTAIITVTTTTMISITTMMITIITMMVGHGSSMSRE